MAFTGQPVSLKKLAEELHARDVQALVDQVEDAVKVADGKFVRFLDAAARNGLVVEPRWTMKDDVPFAPIHTFHLEPIRFGTNRLPMELPPITWNWLLLRLDYPQDAKERLLDISRANALKWIKKRKPKQPSASEERVREAFAWLFGQSFPTARPAWLTKPGYVHPCELDGYCEPLKLAFEFQGDQHYESVVRYGMDKHALLLRQRTDAWKKYEAGNTGGVYLVEVSHDELPRDKGVQAMAEVLLKKLNSNGTARRFLAAVATPQGIALRDAMTVKA